MTSSLPQLLPGFPATSPLPRKVLTLLQSLTKSHLFCEGFPNYLKTIEFPLLLQTQGSLTCLWHTLMALGFTSYRHPLNKGAGSQGQAEVLPTLPGPHFTAGHREHTCLWDAVTADQEMEG